LSVLTRILIVLLAFSTFFLCASVITYVANADNFKQKYTSLRSERDAAVESEKNAAKQLNENIAKSQQLEKKLSNQIASLKTQMGDLNEKLKNTVREKTTLEQKVNSWVSITEGFTKTTDDQRQLLGNTIKELNKVQSDQIKERKELNEISAKKKKKMAIIESLDAENKRLLEEKSDLQSRLDQYLLPGGKISLKGLVTEVDIKNSMASISLGTADGVKQGMRFHATRGDEFICDILIIDSDQEHSVGVIELVQEQLKVGDSVATNF